MTATVGVLTISLVPAAGAAPPSPRCDEANLRTIGDLDAALSSKAVEILRLSSAADAASNLGKLVDPTATFSLGAGDVGRPLGTYFAGARAMSREMNADTFRFVLWSSIPTPVEDACASRTVEVEFINTPHSYSFPVKFTFNHGRLVKAEGWTALFKAGALRRAGTR